MKITKILITIGIMILSFFISSLFFLNSGIIDEKNWKINETQTILILEELNKIPLININTKEIIFQEYGIITEINENYISIKSQNKIKTFHHDKNISTLEKNDEILISYNYPQHGKKEITSLIKYA